MNNLPVPTQQFEETGARNRRSADQQSDEESFVLDVERYLTEAKMMWLLLAAVIMACVLLGLVATLLATPQYRSNARIEVSQVAANVTALDPLESQNQTSELQYLNTQYELLESRFMASRVLEAGNLERDSEFLEAFGFAEEEAPSAEELEQLLLDQLSIQPITQSSLLDVVFASPSATVSAEIADLWAQEFVAANYEKRFGTNIEAREYLRDQIDELRETLSRSEQELVDYANTNGILVLSGGETGEGSGTATQTLLAADLSAINTALGRAIADRIDAEAAVRAGNIADSTADNRVVSQLALAEAELSVLEQTFGPDYPDVQRKRAEVRSLSSSRQDEANAALSSARMRETNLARQLEQIKGRFLTQQNQGIQYGILRREVETNRTLYEALLQRLRELEASGAGQNNIKLIDRAEVPKAPYSPSLIQNLAIGLLAGLGLAGLLVYLRVTLSQAIRTAQDATSKLGMPVLGGIPMAQINDLNETLSQRSSETSEAYRSLRTNLVFLTPQGAPQVLLLTSTVPAEGKSLSAVALAASFAQLGKKVLLIDADLRNSKLEGTLGLTSHKKGGLAALLTNPNLVVQQEMVRVEDLEFDYVPIGHRPPNPADLLASPRLMALVNEAREDYDQIIIDCAPLLSLADAVETARAADGIVYVVEANRVKARVIESSIERLKRSGTSVYGVLLTKLDQRSADYGYGYGYGYGSADEGESSGQTVRA